jgi:hypothetical protein
MARRRKDGSPSYTLLSIRLSRFTARIDASVNYMVRDPRHYQEDAKVYEFASSLEVEGDCTHPKERAGEPYRITVYGHEPNEGQFALTLADCQARDDKGLRRYRKRGDKQVPLYNVPKGIGLLDRQRGTRIWAGTAWVSPQVVTDMLTLLPHVRPLYIAFQELRVERTRWIVSLTLQTSKPDEG